MKLTNRFEIFAVLWSHLKTLKINTQTKNYQWEFLPSVSLHVWKVKSGPEARPFMPTMYSVEYILSLGFLKYYLQFRTKKETPVGTTTI